MHVMHKCARVGERPRRGVAGAGSAGVAEADQLRRAAALEVLEYLLRELGVPALGADQLAGKVAHAAERAVGVLVEGDVLAEEQGVAGLTEDLLLGRLERGVP